MRSATSWFVCMAFLSRKNLCLTSILWCLKKRRNATTVKSARIWSCSCSRKRWAKVCQCGYRKEQTSVCVCRTSCARYSVAMTTKKSSLRRLETRCFMWPPDTMQNMAKTHSNPSTLQRKARNISWSLWTALTTVRFTRIRRTHIASFRWESQSSVRFAVMSRVASSTAWLAWEVSRRTMPIFSAAQTRWRMSSSEWWTSSLSCSRLWSLKASRLRFHCATRWIVRSISDRKTTGKKPNRLLSRLAMKKACLRELNMAKRRSMALSSTLW